MEGQFVNWQSWWNPIEGQPAKLEQAKSFEFKPRRFISVVFIAPILLWVILEIALAVVAWVKRGFQKDKPA